MKDERKPRIEITLDEFKADPVKSQQLSREHKDVCIVQDGKAVAYLVSQQRLDDDDEEESDEE